MKEKEKRKQIIKISVFITSIFIIFLSVTYAFINMSLIGTKRQVITAGNLELELQEDENNLTITNAMPMYDEVGMIQEAFTFRLVNKTATDTNYIVKLVDITTGEKLPINIVRYGLTKDENIKIAYISSLIENRLDTGIIKGNQVIHYSLNLWIDSDVTDETLIVGKTLSYRIEVEISQKIELNPSGTLCSAHNDSCYPFNELSSVVRFENKIDIPDTIPENEQWDVSEEQNGSVMSYVERNENGDLLHIQGNGGIFLPEDSSYLFDPVFEKVEGLEFLDTSKVVTMAWMFSGAAYYESLDFSILQWDTSNVTDMTGMFSGPSFRNLNLVGLDTSNVTDMTSMFEGSSLHNLNLVGMDTSNVTNMTSMFCASGIDDLFIANLDASNVVSISNMFDSSKIENLNLSNLNFSSVTNVEEMFAYFQGTYVNLSGIDFSGLTDMSIMISNAFIEEITLNDWNMPNVLNMSNMFSYSGIRKIHFNNWDTSSVTDMRQMFFSSAVEEVDLSSFNTSNVTDMELMFADCQNLKNVDLSSFDTRNVTNMNNIFYSCKSLISLDLSNFVFPNKFLFELNAPNIQKLDIRNLDIDENRDLILGVASDCLIIVKNQSVKDYILDQKAYTNIVIYSD